MKNLTNGTITSPKGYTASGVTAGIKRSGALDLAVILSEVPCNFACALTNNSFAAAPVLYCRDICKGKQRVRAIVANSGNANACTGAQGVRDVLAMAEHAAQCLDIKPQEIFVSSTGRIGVPLPMPKIRTGIETATHQLSTNGGIDAADAILTTDNVRKTIAVQVELDGVDVTIGGIAKGAGMLYPKLQSEHPHATMLAYITTDVAIDDAYFRDCLEGALDLSFNRISVDGDTSTNDTFIALANGMANNPAINGSSEGSIKFREAFDYVATELARMMVMDGEGATKFVEVIVSGAKTVEQARHCAECIGNSVLCKTAWFGADPNWGRILDAAGYSGAEIEPDKVTLKYDDIPVFKNGIDADTSDEERTAILNKREFTVHLHLGIGDGKFTFWTCDLSYDYIKINADYRT